MSALSVTAPSSPSYPLCRLTINHSPPTLHLHAPPPAALIQSLTTLAMKEPPCNTCVLALSVDMTSVDEDTCEMLNKYVQYVSLLFLTMSCWSFFLTYRCFVFRFIYFFVFNFNLVIEAISRVSGAGQYLNHATFEILINTILTLSSSLLWYSASLLPSLVFFLLFLHLNS